MLCKPCQLLLPVKAKEMVSWVVDSRSGMARSLFSSLNLTMSSTLDTGHSSNTLRNSGMHTFLKSQSKAPLYQQAGPIHTRERLSLVALTGKRNSVGISSKIRYSKGVLQGTSTFSQRLYHAFVLFDLQRVSRASRPSWPSSLTMFSALPSCWRHMDSSMVQRRGSTMPTDKSFQDPISGESKTLSSKRPASSRTSAADLAMGPGLS